MEQVKYGVKIPWPDIGDMWVTEHGPAFNMEPKLFESLKAAEDYAQRTWGAIAKVVKYKSQ